MRDLLLLAIHLLGQLGVSRKSIYQWRNRYRLGGSKALRGRWQNQSLMPSYGPPIDETIVRIRSEHKWPQKVEPDTTMPIIMPPPVAETVETTTSPAPKPALNALAQAKPAAEAS